MKTLLAPLGTLLMLLPIMSNGQSLGENGPQLPIQQNTSTVKLDAELAMEEEAYILERKTRPKSTFSPELEGQSVAKTLDRVLEAKQVLQKWLDAKIEEVETAEAQLTLAQAQKKAMVKAILEDEQADIDPEEEEWEADDKRDRIHLRSMALQEIEIQIWQLEEKWVEETSSYASRLSEMDELTAIQEACELMIVNADAD